VVNYVASAEAYLVGLIILAIVAVVFAVLWFLSYTNYTNLEIRYVDLQNQYQALEANYNKLITALTNAESYSGVYYLNPGNGVMFDFIVPKGYNATVSIDASSSDVIGVFVTPLDVFNEYEEGLITS
jgi:hypothetical protein